MEAALQGYYEEYTGCIGNISEIMEDTMETTF